MKKVAIIILVLVVGFFVYQKVTKEKEPVTVSTTKTYNSSQVGLSFVYPNVLSASTTGKVVTLHHQIPYKNSGDCDMVGEEIIYDNLTDFKVDFEISSKGLVATMKERSPYIPQENFVGDVVVESPGFIDAYSVGEFSGYAIYEGAEGCGRTTYYFPIANDKTLFITKMSIQVLSGVISKEKEAEVLRVPGVIARDESDAIFRDILLTLEIK